MSFTRDVNRNTRRVIHKPFVMTCASLMLSFTSSASAFANIQNISNSSELENILINGDYVLTGDINIGASFTPVPEFKGTLNGGGNAIVMTSARSAPIFLQLTNAVIRNLEIQANINSGDNVTGALARSSTNSEVSYIELTGTIFGGNKTGGLIGEIDAASRVTDINVANLSLSGGSQGTGSISATNDGQISNVSIAQNVIISGSSNVGGITGFNSGVITSVTNDGDIKGREILGGIAGQNSGSISNATYGSNADMMNDGVNYIYQYVGGITGKNSGEISNSNVAGDLKGLQIVGGVSGENLADGFITNSTMSGRIFGDELSPLRETYLYTGQQIGGVAGINRGEINASTISTTARIEGNGNVGGVVGTNFNGGEVRNSQVSATINGIGSVGGVVGVNLGGGIVHTSTVNSTIFSSFPVGGIVGNNAGAIYNSISNSTINADQYVGGIAGINTGTIVNAVVSEGSRIFGNGATGGAVGMNSGLGTVFKVFVNGEVSAVRLASGVVGINTGTVYLSNFSGTLAGEITDRTSQNFDGGTTNQLTSKITDLMSEAVLVSSLIPDNATVSMAEEILQNLVIIGITTSADNNEEVYQISLNSSDFAKTQLKTGSTVQLKIQGSPDQIQSLWIISSTGKILNVGEITFDSFGNAVLPVLTLTQEANLQFVWGDQISPMYNANNEIESLSVGSNTGILNIEVKN